jgi:hypothetical protein
MVTFGTETPPCSDATRSASAPDRSRLPSHRALGRIAAARRRPEARIRPEGNMLP